VSRRDTPLAKHRVKPHYLPDCVRSEGCDCAELLKGPIAMDPDGTERRQAQLGTIRLKDARLVCAAVELRRYQGAMQRVAVLWCPRHESYSAALPHWVGADGVPIRPGSLPASPPYGPPTPGLVLGVVE
jgi:hypothetical protein